MASKDRVSGPERTPFFNETVWCPRCQRETKHKLAAAGYNSPSPYFGGYFSMPAVIQCEECKLKHT